MASPLGNEPKPVSTSARPVNAIQGRETLTDKSVPFPDVTRTILPLDIFAASACVRRLSLIGSAREAPLVKSSNGALLIKTCLLPALKSASLKSSYARGNLNEVATIVRSALSTLAITAGGCL